MEEYIGLSAETQLEFFCFFYSDASLNVILADHLQDEVLLHLKKQVVSRRSSITHQLTTLGGVSFTVKLNSFSCRQPFVAVLHLLRTLCFGPINKISCLPDPGQTSTTDVGLCNRDYNIASCCLETTCLPIAKEELRVRFNPPSEPKVYVANYVLLPPQSETIVLVTMKTTRTYLLENYPRFCARHKVSLENGVATIERPNKSFPVSFSTCK